MSDRDKFLTEQMGECYHDISFARGSSSHPYCTKCDNGDDCSVQDFSTWEGFGKLWEWAQEQDWWRSLEYTLNLNRGVFLNTIYINPDRFADAVYAFLKEGK